MLTAAATMDRNEGRESGGGIVRNEIGKLVTVLAGERKTYISKQGGLACVFTRYSALYIHWCKLRSIFGVCCHRVEKIFLQGHSLLTNPMAMFSSPELRVM